uniref:Endonuclease/exonuclease/phosphatase domain-containing protein n=1 Tax=Latimeria chalumnae TaxID=7897 RepID=H2ZX64_LATCH
MSDLNLFDAWRITHPNVRDYTFISGVHLTSSRIDMIFVSKPILDVLSHSSIQPIVISDHAPITISFIPPCRRWRLNNYSIKITETQKIEAFVSVNEGSTNIYGSVWETLKCYLRGWFLSHNTDRKKDKVRKAEEYLQNIKSCEQQMRLHPSEATWAALLESRAAYDDLALEQVEFLINKTALCYSEQGERSKLLSLRFKKQEAAHVIPPIKSEESNSLITDPIEINKSFARFYFKLYTPEAEAMSNIIEEFLKPLTIPQLTEEQRDCLEAPISEAEVLATIRSMTSDKNA